jgi:hypothetical protein
MSTTPLLNVQYPTIEADPAGPRQTPHDAAISITPTAATIDFARFCMVVNSASSTPEM